MITMNEIDALRKMTVPQIRRAQNIVQMQIPLAHAKRNTKALAVLREWEQTYVDELLRRST